MFREKIKLAIGEKNLRTNTIALSCGIPPTSLSSYLSGNRGIKYEQLEKIVEHLGLTLSPKKDFHFHSEFLEKQEEEHEAKIASRKGL